jgi:peptide/nickel transport system ATP-binding protein
VSGKPEIAPPDVGAIVPGELGSSRSEGVLAIENLSVSYASPAGPVPAVRGVSLTLSPGERLAVVGESGSGKTTLFSAVLGLLPKGAQVEGRAFLGKEDLLSLPEKALAAIRGRRIAMVVQNPGPGFDPSKKVGDQIKEALVIHRLASKREAKERVLALLAEAGLEDPVRVAALSPHQLSGGMAQRAMIAMMLAAEPQVLICDEPTSALDAPLRRAVLELIDGRRRQRGLSVALVSHDLRMVAGFADTVVVMYAGRVVEKVAGSEIESATHPYTRGLLACLPNPDRIGLKLDTLARDPAWLL